MFFSISPACAPESSPHDARERLFADGDPDALRARGFTISHSHKALRTS